MTYQTSIEKIQLKSLIKELIREVLTDMNITTMNTKRMSYEIFKRDNRKEWTEFMLYIKDRTNHFPDPIVNYDDWLVSRYESLWQQYKEHLDNMNPDKETYQFFAQDFTDIQQYLNHYCQLEISTEQVIDFCKGELSLDKQGITLIDTLMQVKHLKAAKQF